MRRKSNTACEDAAIAATGIVHRVAVVTRNVGHVEAFSVPPHGPFKA